MGIYMEFPKRHELSFVGGSGFRGDKQQKVPLSLVHGGDTQDATVHVVDFGGTALGTPWPATTSNPVSIGHRASPPAVLSTQQRPSIEIGGSSMLPPMDHPLSREGTAASAPALGNRPMST